MEIKVVKSVIVKPASKTPIITIKTSNLDLVMPVVHILRVYFYRSNKEPSFFDTKILKQALRNTLVSFHPFAGRLAGDNDGRIEILCNGEGVLFVEAETTSYIDDMGDFSPTNNLYPHVDYSLGIGSFPLAVFQVTRFECGGAALAVGVVHILADGTSIGHFVRTWSDVARGEGVKQPPFMDRTVVRARDPPMAVFPHAEYHPSPALISEMAPELGKTKTAMFTLTEDQIERLKEKAKETSYTTFEVVAGHIWRCACKARGLDDEQETKLHIATDGRRRLRPTLPEGYLGNVVFNTAPTARAAEVNCGLDRWAMKIHEGLKRMDDEYLRSALDYLELLPDPSKLVRGPLTFSCSNLAITSWVRLPAREVDFGWGGPVFVGPGKGLNPGVCILLPNLFEDGGLRVAIALKPQHIMLFQCYLFEF